MTGKKYALIAAVIGNEKSVPLVASCSRNV